MDTGLSEAPIVSFRPIKRQKHMRKRADESDDVPLSESNTVAGQRPKSEEERRNISQESQENDGPDGGVSNITRPRKPNRMRKGGIEFSTSNSQVANTNDANNLALTVGTTEADIIKAKFDRFTAHTGQTVDVNKHMMEYIESELAKRQNRTQAHDERPTADRHGKLDGDHSFTNAFSKREPATLGKLHEIDLGQEAKLQNIARTEAATRRMAGNPSGATDDELQSPGQLEAGKNSKTWRSRPRNREDIERDRLVEEVLRESKLDVYDEPEQPAMQDDQAADDRIAEQFRRDFMEAIQSRRRTMRARATTNKINKKTTKPEPPRGPKLGGSRSARAAMREMQEKSGKK
ncbi:hypothetical protein UA08_09107 [Talaromyces atroroseus]|uniref:Hepatocellular carcinoma-associated antigen 59-domain-containing protein n=1 Tax=Talaromyces atroroseus TaxID=1441469 RepID=A0A1Q5Q7C7_TALAT|nr:hypothetical protein UA08_09107 [Talaromyces atroroseus]OKL55640.1 hypothetical protein UA08_09107 [Talaromyces atroroseus]